MLQDKNTGEINSRFSLGEGRPLKTAGRLAAVAGAVGIGIFGVAAGFHAIEASGSPNTAYEIVDKQSDEALRDTFLTYTMGAAGVTAAGVVVELIDRKNRPE